ncbi:unnamed protein product [Symbiodinium sp. CCMP2456]|nr:unnamed protein product [Symbiodinium sp. CCMP2456]
MASGTGSVGRTKDGVPIWDGDPGSYNEFAEAVRLYEQGTAYHKRPQVGPRVAAELTGAARRFISGQPADWLSYQGGTEALLEHLRKGLGKPRVAEVTEHLSKFFKYCKRKPSESINEYVARRAEVYLRAQQALARLPQAAASARPTSRSGATTPTWHGTSTTWSRRTSVDTVAEEDNNEEDRDEPTGDAASNRDSWTWYSEPWWYSGWSSTWGSQWSSEAGGSWGGSSYRAANVALPEILPDFVQGWLLLQDAGLDANERGLVLTTAGEDFRVATISNALRAHFPDGDLKRRDGGRKQHGYWGTTEDDEVEDWEPEPQEEAEVAENLNDEGFAMWSEAQNEIAEALAAIGGAKKTLKEARAKQHAVKMSRQYFRVGGKSTGKGAAPRRHTDDSQLICLGCGKKGHRVANCPNPQAANLAENETASFICFSEHLEAPETEILETSEKESEVPTADCVETETASYLREKQPGQVDGEAYATGITTQEALEQLMAVNVAAYGDPRVLDVDKDDRPVFGFGNSSTDRCTSTVRMGLQAGPRQGAVQVHALDKGDGPILLSIEAMTMLGALVDFKANLAVFRHLDATKLVPLERSATGHMLVPLSGDLFCKARDAVQKIPSLAEFLSGPADE